MKAWSYWYPDVMPHVKNCPAPVIDNELLRASQAFFTATRAWKIVLNPIAVSAGTSTITVPMDPGLDLVRVESALYDGQKITLTTAEELDEEFNDDWLLHTGTPSRYLQLEAGVVMLYPKPIANSSIGLKLRVSAQPSDEATGIPDAMAAKFRLAIEVGAKGKLMLHADKSWTNFDLAASYLQQFNGLVDTARVNAARSYAGGRIPSRPQWR